MSTARSPQTRQLLLKQPFPLESGEELPGVVIAYRTWGRLSPQGDNAVIVCHALTGSADVDQWWQPLLGAGKVLDPERDFIVCSNTLGGCYGSTGPQSLAPDGRPWAGRFPAITIRDQVRLQMRLADHLGVRRIRFVLGGSMGGLQALEWAMLDPQRVGAVISIAAAGRHSPWCVAWSEAQRQALFADPRYRGGDYPADDPPLAGLAAARAMAMISYRSPGSLRQRFVPSSGSKPDGSEADAPGAGAVRHWLRHHGQALVSRFDANSYLTLLAAMDRHDLARGRGDYASVLANIRQPVLIGSVNSDALYLPDEQRELAQCIPLARHFEIDSPHGHDAFLIEAAAYEPQLRHFVQRLDGGTRSVHLRNPVTARDLLHAW